MSILEIIWVLGTIGNLIFITRCFSSDEFDSEFALFLILCEIVSIIFLICYFWNFLTTPLWG